MRQPHEVITEKIKRQPAKTLPPKFLVCDNPISGAEIYVLNTKTMFLLRVHDMTVIEGKASPQEIEEAKDWYMQYLSFLQ